MHAANLVPFVRLLHDNRDFVLFQRDTSTHVDTKITPELVGPYEVICQTKNDVSCKHVVLGKEEVFHVPRLKIFHGSPKEAEEVAMIDGYQQSVIVTVAYAGDPSERSKMSFSTRFAGG